MNTVISVLLSLLYPGLGQLYAGRRLRGILFISGELIITFINTFTNGYLDLLFYGVYIWALVDAVILARKSEDHQFLRGGRLVIEVGLAAVISLSLMYGAQYLGEWSLGQLLFQEKSPEEIAKVKEETKRYLEERYDEAFEVKNARYIHSVGKYNVIAKPKSKPQLKFGVSVNDSITTFEDRYLYELWSDQATEETKSIVDQAFNEEKHFLKVGVGFNEELMNDIRGKVPSLMEMRKTYPDDYDESINLFLIKDVTDPGLEAKKIYQLVTFIQEQGLRATVQVEYYDEDLLKNGIKEVNPDNSYEYKEYLRKMVVLGTSEQVQDISSPEDIEPLFRVIK